MTRRWTIGDMHDCPRHDSRHVAAAPLEDLRKARWYVDREIARREQLAGLPQRDADGKTGIEY